MADEKRNFQTTEGKGAMTKNERRKAMADAVAVASGHAFVPAAVRVGLAAMVEELREQDARIQQLEKGNADAK